MDARSTSRLRGGFLDCHIGVNVTSPSQGISLALVDHRLAILVHQGSDPTLPYQTLVIRESAMLYLGFAPGRLKAFIGCPDRNR